MELEIFSYEIQKYFHYETFEYKKQVLWKQLPYYR